MWVVRLQSVWSYSRGFGGYMWMTQHVSLSDGEAKKSDQPRYF
jgi:hypothetical protein